MNFVVQAVNGVGRVTIDDNLGAFYRFGSIPGPGDPGASPPDPTTMTFVTPPPGSVKYGQEFQVKVELKKAGGTPLSGKLVRIGIGGNALPDTTNASGVATVTLRAALTPGGYQVTGSFAGDAADAASDVSANVNVQAQPTTLTLSGTLGTAVPLAVTLKANTSPATPLAQRAVFVIIKGGGVTKVFSGKTDPQGRVELPASLLSSLPAATFTVDGYFNGVNAPPTLTLPPDDVDYGHSEAHTNLTLWAFTGFFDPVDNPPIVNVVKAGLAIPFRFSLGGDRGMNIFANDYPKVTAITCPPGDNRRHRGNHQRREERPALRQAHEAVLVHLEDADVVQEHLPEADHEVRRRDGTNGTLQVQVAHPRLAERRTR